MSDGERIYRILFVANGYRPADLRPWEALTDEARAHYERIAAEYEAGRSAAAGASTALAKAVVAWRSERRPAIPAVAASGETLCAVPWDVADALSEALAGYEAAAVIP